MKTSQFDYHLPEERIAQHPLPRRDDSRLLVVDRRSRTLEHRIFRELPDLIGGGNILFRNNATVIPARLLGHRPTGGRVECLLVRAAAAPSWWCLVRPARKLAPGATFGVPGRFHAKVVERGEEGMARVVFEGPAGPDPLAIARECGEVPLPPYIRARRTAEESRADRERYGTVYADPARPVAVAAPTAGLHFTPELVAAVEARGNRFADLTLHVGLGTFRPMQTEHVRDHAIHREVYEVPAAVQALAFAPPGRRIAIGTTSVRALEDLARHRSAPGPDFLGEAGLFLYPPADFRVVDALITNFHAPRSTLLCLVSAFLTPGSDAGIAWLHEIYREALDRGYRFLSYGDAMLIR